MRFCSYNLPDFSPNSIPMNLSGSKKITDKQGLFAVRFFMIYNLQS